MSDQEPRYLGRVIGYTSRPGAGLKGEPEALSEDDQREMTEATARRARNARIDARTATSEDIERELGYLDARSRYLRRQLARLKRPV